jgi:hypothetical protein
MQAKTWPFGASEHPPRRSARRFTGPLGVHFATATPAEPDRRRITALHAGGPVEVAEYAPLRRKTKAGALPAPVVDRIEAVPDPAPHRAEKTPAGRALGNRRCSDQAHDLILMRTFSSSRRFLCSVLTARGVRFVRMAHATHQTTNPRSEGSAVGARRSIALAESRKPASRSV